MWYAYTIWIRDIDTQTLYAKFTRYFYAKCMLRCRFFMKDVFIGKRQASWLICSSMRATSGRRPVRPPSHRAHRWKHAKTMVQKLGKKHLGEDSGWTDSRCYLFRGQDSKLQLKLIYRYPLHTWKTIAAVLNLINRCTAATYVAI